MKRFNQSLWVGIALFMCVQIIGFAAWVNAQSDISTISSKFSASVLDEIGKIPDRPHFLLGLDPKDDVWEQFLERRKVFQTNDLFYGKAGLGIIDKSRDDYHASGNTELSEMITISGKSVRILYTHHHRLPDGIYEFWSRMGRRNLATFSPVYRKYEMRWGSGVFSDDEWSNL